MYLNFNRKISVNWVILLYNNWKTTEKMDNNIEHKVSHVRHCSIHSIQDIAVVNDCVTEDRK